MQSSHSNVSVELKMMRALFRAVIMGPPGSGKGTISEWIVRDFALKALTCGDLIRQHILSKTDIGLEMEKYIDKGELVPDDLVTKLMLEDVTISSKDESWLLDGFPRTVPQAEALCQRTALSCVINLAVPEDEIRRRIEGRWIHAPSGRTYHTEFNPPNVSGKDDVTGEELVQRSDDKPETVRARLASYRAQTEPVLDYYSEKGLLREFRGTESKEIWPHIYKFLSTLTTPVRPPSI